MELKDWQGARAPERRCFEGRYTRLEPLAQAHGADLYAARGEAARFQYLFDDPPVDMAAQIAWIDQVADRGDPMFFAVVDRATGRAQGRQALMRQDLTHGVIEVGSILWGPAIARTRVTTESLFLMADHIFAQGFRRFEWKCHVDNAPSQAAARRFGFTPEGVFRQHMIVKGANRDTAWFSMLDHEWPHLRAEYVRWLAPENFDGAGRQLTPLRFD